jgi:hypothetical protein
MDAARHAGVSGHVFVQGLQQGIMHARIHFAVPGHRHLPHGPKAVQDSVNGRIQDCCSVLCCRMPWCRVPGQLRRELLRRQLGPGDVGRRGRRLSRLFVWGLVQSLV